MKSTMKLKTLTSFFLAGVSILTVMMLYIIQSEEEASDNETIHVFFETTAPAPQEENLGSAPTNQVTAPTDGTTTPQTDGAVLATMPSIEAPAGTVPPDTENAISSTSGPTEALGISNAGSFEDTGDDSLNSMCDEVLNSILSENMTQREKAYAIYQWVVANVRYLGVSDTTDWIEGAKEALSSKRGNCYAFYSASRALLTRAGFENVEAVSINRGHFWNIVKVDGLWRHFDATPGWGVERFLWTGTQIAEYKYYSGKYQHYIAYLWDPEGCPDTD